MYLDCDIQLYQVTKNLFNVRIQIYNDKGDVIRELRYERMSWSAAVHMARVKYLSTRAGAAAKIIRDSAQLQMFSDDETLPF